MSIEEQLPFSRENKRCKVRRTYRRAAFLISATRLVKKIRSFTATQN